MTPLSMSIPSSPRQDNAFTTQSTHFPVLEDASIFSGLAGFGSEANDIDFIMSPMDSPFDLLGVDSSSITQTPSDIESLLILADRIDLDNASFDTPSSLDLLSELPSTVSSLASNVLSISTGKSSMTDITDISPCGCLTQTLDLLKKLSPIPASPCTTFLGLDATAMPSTANTASAQVLLENKQNIEVISSKLACPFVRQ
jgi:hypothetical protein